ncbi:MAG TPA: anti-sigma factor [Acetobacteraceae bacterium]|nr:anti-sigma factor [Acetobacteraceae bacterium]
MLADHTIPDDEDLQAYVDDRLSAGRRREVEVYLASQPVMARRVSAYRAQRNELRAAFAAIAAEPIPARLDLNLLMEERLEQERRPIWWRIAAAAVLCLGLGGSAGWFFGNTQKPDSVALAVSQLQQQAMASHLVYADDRRHPIEVAGADREQLAQWLSNRLHRPVTPPDLSGLGYKLLGGRLLATEQGSTAAMFVYDDPQGVRLSVVERPMASGIQAERDDMASGKVLGCTWIDGGMGYAIVAALPDEVIDRVADQIAGQAGRPS